MHLLHVLKNIHEYNYDYNVIIVKTRTISQDGLVFEIQEIIYLKIVSSAETIIAVK